MTEVEQRIAIAEFCGWKFQWTFHTVFCSAPGSNIVIELDIPKDPNYCLRKLGVPDYLHDLNAMHEAEKLIPDDKWYAYNINLDWEIRKDSKGELSRGKTHASASQRAKALFALINKQ